VTLNPYPTPLGMLTSMTSLTFHMLLLLVLRPAQRRAHHRENVAGGRLIRRYASKKKGATQGR
jgi:hypothetical protein